MTHLTWTILRRFIGAAFSGHFLIVCHDLRFIRSTCWPGASQTELWEGEMLTGPLHRGFYEEGVAIGREIQRWISCEGSCCEPAQVL